jgi:hypothetical protein
MSQLATAPSSLPSGHPELRSEITDRILDAVNRTHVCEMEELVKACSSYTWNQVFLEVDRLTRSGDLRLLPKRAGVYAVTLPLHRPLAGSGR